MSVAAGPILLRWYGAAFVHKSEVIATALFTHLFVVALRSFHVNVTRQPPFCRLHLVSFGAI